MSNKLPDFFDEVRLNSLKTLREKQINPYPYEFKVSHSIKELLDNFENLKNDEIKIGVIGRIFSKRPMGRAMFIEITHEGFKMQVYLKSNEIGNSLFKTIMKHTHQGDILGINGFVFNTKTGEQTIHAEKVEILSKCLVNIPYGKTKGEQSWYGLDDVEIKRQERYLDWLTDSDSFNRFKSRYEILAWTRDFMRSKNFLEVETPTIESVYGGAEARPFKTTIHSLSNKEAYLRISPELYLKRFIIGGYDKVFTICKNFRNEGIDATHNPEFTMMEWYEAFVDYEHMMKVFEELVCFLVEKKYGELKCTYKGKEIDFSGPWKRISLINWCKDNLEKDFSELTKEEIIEKFIEKIPEANKEKIKKLSKGALLLELFEELEEDKLWNPCFVMDYPKDISPLTKEKRDNSDFVERFEPYVACMELGNSYSELTDPVEQYERFYNQRNQEAGNDKDYEDHPIDMDFVKAIGCGMPPTGGAGIGLDRIIMVLTDAENVRDIIPFPMMKK